MRILESKILKEIPNQSVRYIRIHPENLQTTLAKILTVLNEKSWISKFPLDLQSSYQIRVKETVERIAQKFAECSEDSLISEAGEYVVSELAREAIISDPNYFDIPLAELIGKKIAGNPGFDFYSKNNTNHTIIFGESKYNARQSAYQKAIEQVDQFIRDKKDIKDLPDFDRLLDDRTAISRANAGNKGYAIAFSAKTTSSDKIIASIQSLQSFKELLVHDEIIIVAVNLP